ncbi:MAG: hypothetical protein GXP31_02005 [Kiritimatiellaeota bacterium]|nr:hypothetical protein [Kiritimatiellota bacterium]
MRRTIGSAYERSPAERISRWVTDNLMRVISAIVVAVVFCFLVDATVNRFFNFLDTNGQDDVQGRFTSEDPRVDAVKTVGSLLLIFFVCRRKK